MSENSIAVEADNNKLTSAKQTLKEDAPQYLTFKMKSDLFGVSIMQVREIIEYGKLTRVPMTPPYIAGVINLRGQVVPVLNLGSYFHIGSIEIAATTCIVVIEIIAESESENETIGILVDAVDEVIEIPERLIEPAPGFGARVNPDYLKGVGKTSSGFVLLLDIDKTFDLEKLSNFNAFSKKTGSKE